MKNIRIFYLKIFFVLVVKFSVYLNRRVFVILVRISADDSLKRFCYFSQEIEFETSCKFCPNRTIYMKCQIIFI